MAKNQKVLLDPDQVLGNFGTSEITGTTGGIMTLSTGSGRTPGVVSLLVIVQVLLSPLRRMIFHVELQSPDHDVAVYPEVLLSLKV